ncbi:MAG: hypothetical protein FJZ96_15885, partial [Chloroflexi bacterium]|nr:hypothetical protein [Chloroflexota bacterium]
MNDHNRLVLHDRPAILWFFGLMAIGIGFALVFTARYDWFVSSGLFVLGAALLVLPAELTITADKAAGVLRLVHRSILGKRVREVGIGEIDSIRVERSQSSDGGSVYRVAVYLKDGQSIPFRSYYSSGYNSKAQQAGSLRDFLNVGGLEQDPGELLNPVSSLLQRSHERSRDLLASSPVEERFIMGIRWQVRKANYGGSSIVRIFTDEMKWTGFLYLAQKAPGQSTPKGGMLASLNRMIFEQSIGMFGFDETDTPNREFGETVSSLDPQLEPHFTAFTSDPESARQLLDPWVVRPMAEWGSRHPLKMVANNKSPGQL